MTEDSFIDETQETVGKAEAEVDQSMVSQNTNI
jgi:hypothetical protein